MSKRDLLYEAKREQKEWAEHVLFLSFSQKENLKSQYVLVHLLYKVTKQSTLRICAEAVGEARTQ
jgi:hypothetical protein